MTDYQPMSAPPPEGHGPQPRGEAPASIRTSVTIIWVLLALFVLNSLLTFVYLDDVIAAAVDAQPSPVDEDTVRMVAIVTSLFFLVIFGALYVVLAIFLRKGHNWARIVVTILASLGIVFGLFGLFGPQPTALLITGVLSLALQVALLYFLWQKDASAYLKPHPAY